MSAFVLFLGGWSVIQKQEMQQRKVCDICNCSLIHWARALWEWWRLSWFQHLQLVQNSNRSEVDLQPWRSAMIQPALHVSVGNLVCTPHFINWKKQPTHIIDAGFYTVGHPLHPNYRWASSSFHNAATVSMCLQRVGFCCTNKRNAIHFESPIVGVNACVRQTFGSALYRLHLLLF